ncbi:MAG: hypothetical protein ACLGHZ_01285 [Actinomycetes bacterium]
MSATPHAPAAATTGSPTDTTIVSATPGQHDTRLSRMQAHAQRVRAHRTRRATANAQRAAQVAALYPSARTFALVEATHLGHPDDEHEALQRLPKTLTLVTPDHSDPSQDHLFVGPYPVPSTQSRFDDDFQELTFTSHDGTDPIHVHLRLARARTRAFGVIEFGGESYSVEYAVKPQRFTMRIGKGAGYLAGSSTLPELKWDVHSDRWKNASWSTDPEVAFTYGVDGQEVLDGEDVLTFVASFDDLQTSKHWDPVPGYYSGLLDARLVLRFGVIAGVTPPASGRDGGTLFPFRLAAKMSEFGDRFDGAMLTDAPSLQGTVYGVQGTWAGGNIAGLYHLTARDAATGSIVGVHDGRLHVGAQAVPSEVDGSTVRWTGMPDELARTAGLPIDGHLTFSADGATIVDSASGHTGVRVSHSQAADAAASGSASVHGLALAAPAPTAEAPPQADPSHTLTALLAMSQFALSDTGNYYDQFQSTSMEDFYAILQDYMDPELRKQFFNPNPPPLDPGLRAIAETPGRDGEDPKAWYRSLSVAYTTGTLSKWSTDRGCALLNGRRADTWLSNQTGVSPVMLAQGPLLYARRYMEKYTNLDWFLQDQHNNAAGYEAAIRAKADQWIADMEANAAGTPEEIAKLRKQIADLRDAAITNKLYWAFAVYTYTTTPAYLNMLQTIMASGDEVDGSEFTQRVQRTTALLNVLDTSSYFTQQYAYVLQLFQVASVLPQMMDYTADLTKFSYAVKQIVDKFVEQNINSQDPKMREAAEALRKEATEDLVGKILQVLRQTNASMAGLFNWTTLAAQFQSKVAQVFSHIPQIVCMGIFLGAVGLLVNYFLTGKVNWDDIPREEQVLIIFNGAGILAQFVKMLVVRGVAVGEVLAAGNGAWAKFKMFFSPSLMTKAESSMATGFKGWLLQSVGGVEDTLDMLSMRMFFAEAAEAAALQAELQRMSTIHKIFGRNLNEFLATRLGAALAAVGIVMSAILLAQSHEPLEIAANSLFLFASTLELIATAGLWATQAFGIAAIGGVAVGTIFAVVSVVGVIAMVAGAILIAVLMFRPQDTPVEKFAKEKAGIFYMPKKTDIDYFQAYEPLGQQQRSGVSVAPRGDTAHCLAVDADGSLSQRPFDGTGHTALYLRTDELGRAQLGGPVVDDKGARTLMVVALDAAGKLVAAQPTAATTTDPATLWRAEIQSEGTFEKDKDGTERLQSAPFLFYNDGWYTKTGQKRYIATSGTGWAAQDGSGTSLTISMVTTKPEFLSMKDVSWFTYEHDMVASPVLGVPGSPPRTWKLTPDLPTGLTFFPQTGAVAMNIGVDVPAAPQATYTLAVDNKVGQLATTFSLQISEPQAQQ